MGRAAYVARVGVLGRRLDADAESGRGNDKVEVLGGRFYLEASRRVELPLPSAAEEEASLRDEREDVHIDIQGVGLVSGDVAHVDGFALQNFVPNGPGVNVAGGLAI